MTSPKIRQDSAFKAPELLPEQQTIPDGIELKENSPTSWLGMEIDHRRLFDAAQDGWLHPGPTGFVLGRQCFVADPDRLAKPNLIAIRVVLEPRKFPLFENTVDCQRPVEDAPHTQRTEPSVYRRFAPIPLYAISNLQVNTQEEKTRIRAMASQFSNVSLPDASFKIGESKVYPNPFPSSDLLLPTPVELPDCIDAVQGAMAMAIWGAPPVEPWIDALQMALNLDEIGANRRVAELGAQWLRFPWFDQQSPPGNDANAQLWNAALSTMRSPSAMGKSAMQIAERIAQQTDQTAECPKTEEWLCQTLRVIDAEETVDPNTIEAGLAIQLALLRPDPVDFKTWMSGFPSVSPATLWAGAMLCGWRHGYRTLDKQFRGGAIRREFLSTKALVASWQGDRTQLLPVAQRENLQQQNAEGCFSLGWGSRPILRKSWHSRARWFVADLSNETIFRSAKTMARQLGWQCFKRRLSLNECLVPISGQGHLEIDENDSLVVHRSVDLLRPAGTEIIEEFDTEEFKRELASKPGQVPDPPEVQQTNADDVPGLIYRPKFITNEEELALVAHIDAEEWDTSLTRRVQQYGWRYDYKHRKIDATMYLGPLPDWTSHLVKRLVDERYMDEKPDQLIVNEYRGDQGIAAHTDHPDNFAEQVVTISLLETWDMVFRSIQRKNRVVRSLEHGSITVFTSDVRYKLTHEIPKRKYEYKGSGRKRVPRERRISLTFRKTRIPNLGLLT